jgi:hypothetical protein
MEVVNAVQTTELSSRIWNLLKDSKLPIGDMSRALIKLNKRLRERTRDYNRRNLVPGGWVQWTERSGQQGRGQLKAIHRVNGIVIQNGKEWRVALGILTPCKAPKRPVGSDEEEDAHAKLVLKKPRPGPTTTGHPTCEEILAARSRGCSNAAIEEAKRLGSAFIPMQTTVELVQSGLPIITDGDAAK